MSLIKMPNPIAELDGDEMTRILWKLIKDKLITPHVELNTEYYDLSLTNRDDTNDQVTIDAANAIARLKVGVKCATITANAERKVEYKLKRLLPSPNATLRAMLDGTVFRTPITVEGLTPSVSTWRKPITVARHAYGDVYKGVEIRVKSAGTAYLTFVSDTGEETREPIHTFKGDGILQATHNTDESIKSFARSCFAYALSVKQDLWFGSKDTISKTYDHRFKDIFNEIYNSEYKQAFADNGISYYYMLIDDAVARVIRSSGGFVWACKNYDGDVMSDMISSAYGSLAMMTSVLVSPSGVFEYEAAHGTVTRHYYKYLKGETTSTNPIATIFAWTGALAKRGELDGNDELIAFARDLERASLAVIESGQATGDIARLTGAEALTTEGFIDAIAKGMGGR